LFINSVIGVVITHSTCKVRETWCTKLAFCWLFITINKQSTKRQLCTSCFPCFTGATCNNSSNYTINKQSTKGQLCTSCFPYFTGAMCNNSFNYTSLLIV
jgi:hypothetical protein